MSSGGGGNTTTVQKSDPWSVQQPYLHTMYNQAIALPQQQYYPGQTVARLNDVNINGLTQQYGYAQNNWNTGAAEDQLAKSLGGQYLGGGTEYLKPFASGEYTYGGEGFNAALEAARNKILPQINSRFEQSGRFGSGLSRQAEASAVGDAFAGLYNQGLDRQLAASGALADQYQAERMNQMRALGLAPSVANMRAQDYATMTAVGDRHQAEQQKQMDAAKAAWMFQQQAPYDRLTTASGIIQGGFPGSTQTTTAPYSGPSTAQSLLSLGGMGLGAALGGPFGAVLGGSAGGILGGLF